MKKIFLILFVALGLTGSLGGAAHADLLVYYNFSNGDLSASALGQQQPTINNNFNAGQLPTYSTSGSAQNKFAGDPTNASPGSLLLPGGSFAAGATGNNGKYIEFSFSTLGHDTPTLTFATQNSSGNGFTTGQLSYSTGGAFTNFGSYTNATSFAVKTFDFGGTGLNDQSNVTLRFTFSGASSTASNLIDNIQVNAVATPEPETWAMMALGVFALSVLQFRRKRTPGDAVSAPTLTL